jgi:molecular chaperone GrpE
LKKKDEIKGKEIMEEEMEELRQEQEDVEKLEELEDKEQELEKELETAKKEVEEWKGSYARKHAEFQNFAKRKDKEVEELRKYASEKIIIKLLEGVDNLERAISASGESKDFDSLVKGVEMTLNQFHNVLQGEGVASIETDGKEYDPYQHQAMMTEASDEVEDNYIIQEFQKGYTMNGKVIRPSMVKVCKK